MYWHRLQIKLDYKKDNCVASYTMACRKRSVSLLFERGSRPVVALGNETYKLTALRIWYTDHLEGVLATACCLVAP
jgi:hypothetical protein